MKITLDLDKLLEDGSINKTEYDKLFALSAKSTGSMAMNILVAFGILAVTGGLLALIQSIEVAGIVGALICIIGLYLGETRPQVWGVLANICVLIGALMIGSAIIGLGEGSVPALLATTVIYAAAGIFAKSALLVTLAILASSATLGAQTAYWHATYMVGIEAPTLTVICYTVLAVALYQASKVVPADYSRLAIIGSRTSVFLVNMAFWIGSLWGDGMRSPDGPMASWKITAGTFSVLWALALVVTGAWAAMRNRRWVVNTVAVFASMHFYTQWFESLGASPISILLGGLIAIGIAVAVGNYNKKTTKTQPS